MFSVHQTHLGDVLVPCKQGYIPDTLCHESDRICVFPFRQGQHSLSHDMSSDHTNMQIGCRGLHNACIDVNDCVFTLSLRSCSVFANTIFAVQVLQMVPWAGTVCHPRSSCIVLMSRNSLLRSPCICIKWWGKDYWSPCICPVSGTCRC